MNTVFLLLAEYNRTDIPVTDVASKYLNLNERVAKQRAAAQQLPFPVFRGGPSHKAQLLARVTDLAEYLDRLHAEGVQAWRAQNDPS